MFSAQLENLLQWVKTSPAVKEAAALAVFGLLGSPIVVLATLSICTLVRYIRRKYIWRNHNE